jgi:hypothetical protein
MNNEESTLIRDVQGEPSRWTLIRDIAAFQVKLVVDGLRDFLLVPASLFMGLVSLVRGQVGQDNPFYELMRLGQRSEHWINLFGAARPLPGDRPAADAWPDGDMDQALAKVEGFIKREYQAGGLTRQARERLDRALDALEKKGRPPPGSA